MPKTANVSKGEEFPLFTTISMETSAVCNRTCVFCPNHDNVRPDETMPWRVIKKMVQELKELNYKGLIVPYIYNEPMRDKRFYEICSYISSELPRACIQVSTNCDYIKNAEDVERIFDSGVRQLVMNVYSQHDGCGDKEREAKGVRIATKRADQLQGFLDQFDWIDQEASLYLYAGKGKKIAKVLRKYGVDSENPTDFGGPFTLHNRSGNVDWFLDPLEEPLEKMCTRPFRVLEIDWKGNAILCCNDYHSDITLGNVRFQSLVEMWNADSMQRYRLALQHKRRDKLPMCATCSYHGGAYPHMCHKVTYGSEKKDKRIIEEGIPGFEVIKAAE